MKRSREPGPNDIPLPLWDDEPTSSVVLAEQTVPAINEHGALEGLVGAPRGASVSLGARATALTEIMNYYNQANKTRGAKRSPGALALKDRYGLRGSYEVTTNMGAKTSVLSRVASRAFDTLTAEDAMVEAGFDAYDMKESREEIEQRMDRQYGPGKAFAPDRKKLVTRANRVANLRPKK